MFKITGELLPGKHCCYHGDLTYPRGSNCFYVRTNADRGMKVYYGLDKKQLLGRKVVEKIYLYTLIMSETGICMEPRGVTEVKINVTYRGDRIKCTAYAIIVEHLDMDFVAGKDDYIRKLRARLLKNGYPDKPDHFKPNNIGYCYDEKRFYLVDWI